MACGLRGAGPVEYVRAALAAHRAAVWPQPFVTDCGKSRKWLEGADPKGDHIRQP